MSSSSRSASLRSTRRQTCISPLGQGDTDDALILNDLGKGLFDGAERGAGGAALPWVL